MSLKNTQILKHIPLTKANYKEAYPANTFGSLNNLSRNEIKKMRTYLKEDYEVHDSLVYMAHQWKASMPLGLGEG